MSESGGALGHKTAETRKGSGSSFGDAVLVEYVREVYGGPMASRCSEIFHLDPLNETGFASSIRRSLSRELDALIQHGKYLDGMRD